jgi:mannosyl-3-phosphoglycerate phosphatase
MRRLVFTDLDGTLLGHHDYRWDAARPALDALERLGIPLVFVSSKTRAEMEVWRARMGNRHPFISENGAAIWIPSGGGPPAVLEIGTPYAVLRGALGAIARDTGLALRGFGDMSVDEVRGLTGLSEEDARLAHLREHDEPFVLGEGASAGAWDRILEAARARGLRVTGGGRFRHLTGDNDKGRAARLLVERCYGDPRPHTLALGDSANDLELLRAADDAAVVARPDGTHAPELRTGLPHARFTRAGAPEGFAEAVFAWLEATGSARAQA